MKQGPLEWFPLAKFKQRKNLCVGGGRGAGDRAVQTFDSPPI